jgi:hypothetical protein
VTGADRLDCSWLFKLRGARVRILAEGAFSLQYMALLSGSLEIGAFVVVFSVGVWIVYDCCHWRAPQLSNAS